MISRLRAAWRAGKPGKTRVWVRPCQHTVLGVAAAIALVSLVGVGCGAAAASDSSTGAESSATTRIAARAAPDFSGVTLDGVEVSLSEYRGKPLVLAFMASW